MTQTTPTKEQIDTSDEQCALVCMIVSNPGGRERQRAWQKRVNDLIRALRDERNALAVQLAEAEAAAASAREVISEIESIAEQTLLHADYGRGLGHISRLAYGAPKSTPAPVTPSAPAEANGWRPIETAPKDGTPILAYVAKWECYEAVFWRAVAWAIAIKFDGFMDVPEPTHWRPLPSPPTAREGDR